MLQNVSWCFICSAIQGPFDALKNVIAGVEACVTHTTEMFEHSRHTDGNVLCIASIGVG